MKYFVIFLTRFYFDEYLSKINHNLVHHLSCQAVRRTGYALPVCIKVLALASKVQALVLALTLTLRVEGVVLALRFRP